MTNSGKPSDFWMGRVVMAATIHFMFFGIAAFFFGRASFYQSYYYIYYLLSLPLLRPVVDGNLGNAIASLPSGVPILIALILCVVNSLIWGFTVDGYLRIINRLRRLWRGRSAP